jgi:hypothetical protein
MPDEKQDVNDVLASIEQEVIKETETKIQLCSFDCISEDVKKCCKCDKFFCVIHASNFSPNFCQDCFKNLSVIISKFEKRVEDYDVSTDTVTTHKSSCRQISIDGPSWVFYTAWIKQFTEEQLKEIFEFHYFMVKMIESENENRRVRAAQKIREMPLPFRVTRTKETKTSKTTTVIDPKAELKKKFPKLSEDMIDAMIKVLMNP